MVRPPEQLLALVEMELQIAFLVPASHTAAAVVAAVVGLVVDQVALVVLAVVVQEQFRAVRQRQAQPILEAVVVLLEQVRVLVVLAVQVS